VRAKLTSLTVDAPSGLRFTGRIAGKKLEIRGLKLSGAKIRSLKLAHGDLVISLRHPVARLCVNVRKSLTESRALAVTARRAKRIRAMRLTVSGVDTKHKRLTASIKIAHPRP
jgi:hypothetical protein